MSADDEQTIEQMIRAKKESRGQSKLADVSWGWCYRIWGGTKQWVGIRVTGSNDHKTNNLDSSRFEDLSIHQCDHGCVETCLFGSEDKQIDNRPTHRILDFLSTCGISITIEGSEDQKVDNLGKPLPPSE